MIKRLTNFLCLLLLVVSTSGCHPSTDEISQTVKSSMQQTLDSDSDLKGLHLTVQSVTVIRIAGNSYQGLATIKSPSKTAEIALSITADGKNTMWKTGQGAFFPFIADRSQDSSDSGSNAGESVEPTKQDTFSNRAIQIAQNSYQFKASDPDEVRHGFWTASELPQSQTAPVAGNWVFVVVHYSVLDQNISCEWMIGFPMVDPETHSVTKINECVRQVFNEASDSPSDASTGNSLSSGVPFPIRAIKFIQQTYDFRTNEPDDVRHGFWSTSDLPRSQYPPMSSAWRFVIVHYSLADHDIDCQWSIGEPISEPEAYSPRPLDGCAMTMFDVK